MTESASVAAQFFSPWDPPPPFCSPPSDSKRADVIQKLAQFAAKNGASFVELIKVKQKDNPEYQFLFGGEGSDYYRWILFCSCHNLPVDQPLPAAQPANQQVAQPAYGEAQTAPVQDVEAMLQQALATCSPEVRDGFSQVLAALSGSKVGLIVSDSANLRQLERSSSTTSVESHVCYINILTGHPQRAPSLHVV